MKLWTFSYLGAKSLSLRVARLTSDVSCERANDLIGCQKADVGELGLGGTGAAGWTWGPDPDAGSLEEFEGQTGFKPPALKPRASLNTASLCPASVPVCLTYRLSPFLTMYDSRLGIVGCVVDWNE